ncbi:hypothetical protein D917_10675, partial [Trichinella nativa]
DSVTSGCSNSSESPRTSEISEDSVTSEISEDSETSECSEDSGNSEGSETSEVSDSFQTSSRVAEVGRTNDLQYIVYSFPEESSSSSFSERTYWPELEFEMDEMASSAFEFYLRQREEMLRPRRRRIVYCGKNGMNLTVFGDVEHRSNGQRCSSRCVDYFSNTPNLCDSDFELLRLIHPL